MSHVSHAFLNFTFHFQNYRLARITGNTALISTVIPTVQLLGVAGGIIGLGK